MNHTHFDIDIHVITFVRVCVCYFRACMRVYSYI